MPPDFVPNAGQLSSVWLQAISFTENEEFDLDRHEVQYSLNIEHTTSARDDEEEEEEEEEEEDTTLIEVSLSLDWEATDPEKSSPSPFDLEVVVGGLFTFSDPVSPEQMRAWTEFNGVYLVWPYIRSYVSTVTSFSLLPTFTLPTLAIPRPEVEDSDRPEVEALGADEEAPGPVG